MKSEALLKSHEVRRRDLLILKFVYCLLFIWKKKGMIQGCTAAQIVGLEIPGDQTKDSFQQVHWVSVGYKQVCQGEPVDIILRLHF